MWVQGANGGDAADQALLADNEGKGERRVRRLLARERICAGGRLGRTVCCCACETVPFTCTHGFLGLLTKGNRTSRDGLVQKQDTPLNLVFEAHLLRQPSTLLSRRNKKHSPMRSKTGSSSA